jgi:lipopolysaccharide export system permease protein
MRLLDRYLLRELLLPLGFCLGGFMIFWAAFDLLAHLSDYRDEKMTIADLAHYYLLTAPGILAYLLPIGLLLALLYALTHHAKHNELTAMRAAGISLWRLALPYLAVGFILSLVVLVINEVVAPPAAEKAEGLRTRRVNQAGEVSNTKHARNVGFTNNRERRRWQIGLYDLERNTMANVQVAYPLGDGTLAWLFADAGRYENGSWNFEGVKVLQQISPNDATLYTAVETNQLARPDFTESPEAIRSELKLSGSIGLRRVKEADIPLRALWDYLRFHPNLTGQNHAWFYTKLHGRLAAPWTCLVVVLIAIPFGAPSGRRNVFVGVAGSIFICFAYFVLMQIGLALGSGGWLPAWLAAWLPNLFFSLLAVFLINRVR